MPNLFPLNRTKLLKSFRSRYTIGVNLHGFWKNLNGKFDILFVIIDRQSYGGSGRKKTGRLLKFTLYPQCSIKRSLNSDKSTGEFKYEFLGK